MSSEFDESDESEEFEDFIRRTAQNAPRLSVLSDFFVGVTRG